MIIWGSKVREIVESSGNFHCPECDSEKLYSAISAKKYFTLYFLPLFPLETLGNYIKCDGCKKYFKPAVLHYRPASKEDKVLINIKNDLVAGTPAQMVKQKLVNGGVSQEQSILLIESIIGSNIKSCNKCNLDYFYSVSACSNCGVAI